METIIYKINQKFDKKLYEKKKSLDIKYCKMLDTRKYKLDTKRERELSSYIRKREKQKRYELKLAKSKEKIKENKKINKEILRGTSRKKKIRDTTFDIGNKPKIQKEPKWKKLALKEIQKYAKLSRAVYSTKGPMIFLADKMKRVYLDKNVHGGHCYGQKNFSGLAFDVENIRPIHYITNKTQNDQVGERKKNLPKEIQEYLDKKSEDKSEKRALRDRAFYQDVIKKYKELNIIECERLCIEYK